jgi:CheY-like chemotaxis protein
MPRTKEEILIVDDTVSILTSMSLVLSEIGYRVRIAEEGFGALREIRQSVPDILVSDLNMPGMSGFELLSVVRRRFPAIQTIAMSGGFCGNEVPSGVAADSFFQKGSSIAALLQIVDALAQVERRAIRPTSAPSPLMLHQSEHNSSPDAYATISCPECLRSFSKALDDSTGQPVEAACVHCGCSIQYEIVHYSPQQTIQNLQYEASTALSSQSAPCLSF